MTNVHRVANLPNGWAIVSVVDLGEVRLGRQLSPDKRTGRFKTKYLRAANIGLPGLDLADVQEMDFTPEERARFRLQKGDVVLAEASGNDARVGRAALWNDEIDECCHQNTVIRFRPHATEPEFALLFFRYLASAGVFSSVARGLGIQHLGLRRFSGLDFFLPPAEEQLRIVREASRRLAELTEGKASLRSALDRVEEQRREIYAAATFGTIVATESDANEAERTYGLSSLDAPTDVAIPALTEQEHLTKSIHSVLPKGWTWSTVGELGSVQLGVSRSPKRKVGNQTTRYLRSANIREQGLDIRDVAGMDISPVERERFDLRPGDILVVEASGSPSQVGRSAIWRGEIEGCSYQNHIMRFRSHGADPEYVDLVFKHYRYSGVFAGQARGVGIQHLGARRFSSISVPVPPLAYQAKIAQEAARQLKASEAHARTIWRSLSRIGMMESEILRAAATGELVPQRSGVESATEMLARIGRNRRKRSTDSPRKPMPRHERTAEHENTALTIPDVLRKAGGPVDVREVFVLVGYDRNSTADIEAFYVALRRELGRTVRIEGGVSENGRLELI